MEWEPARTSRRRVRGDPREDVAVNTVGVALIQVAEFRDLLFGPLDEDVVRL